MSKFLSSSIGRKLIMSITGLFLILFLLFHATMNVVVIFSGDAYNAVCEFLGANWYALVGTLVLAAGFLLHILFSIIITLYNKKARGNQHYAAVTRPKKVSWASKNMFVLGLLIVGFAGLHLWQFWAKMQLIEIMGGHGTMIDGMMLSPTDGAGFIAYYFSSLGYCICYLVWLGVLWFHLTHGFWSAFQTIGWNNSTWLPRLECVGKWFATIVCLMFASVVVTFYIQSLLCGGATCL